MLVVKGKPASVPVTVQAALSSVPTIWKSVRLTLVMSKPPVDWARASGACSVTATSSNIDMRVHASNLARRSAAAAGQIENNDRNIDSPPYGSAVDRDRLSPNKPSI